MPMQYLSTRGGSERLSFEQVVLGGLAKNGGLYIPEHIPSLPEDFLTTWKDLSYCELAVEIFSLFINEEDVPREDLKLLVEKSYSTFRHPEVAPLKRVGTKEYVLELFFGPTLAFKDCALQFLGNLFEYFLIKRNKGKSEEERETVTVVGATSGDTGGAAIYGLRSKKDLSIFILHPKNRISPIQEAQMCSVTDDNVFNIAIEGTFDDCQDIVKALFSDAPFNGAYHLGAINSINWARILAQTVYYFSSYFSLHRQLDAEHKGYKFQYCVPTGNFGDVLAGYYAKRLGLPMEKLVVATNANDILPRFWKTGRYEKAETFDAATTNGKTHESFVEAENHLKSTGGVAETLSPAMDILVSSNFERLLFYLAFEGCTEVAGEDQAQKVVLASACVEEWMGKLKTEGRVVVPESAVALARRDMIAQRVSDEETTVTIQKYYESSREYGSYVLDPHTAVGVEVANRLVATNAEDIIQVILATAHPAKFSAAVVAALESQSTFDFDRDVMPKEFEGLLDLPRKMFDVVNSTEAVKVVIAREVARLASEKKLKDLSLRTAELIV